MARPLERCPVYSTSGLPELPPPLKKRRADQNLTVWLAILQKEARPGPQPLQRFTGRALAEECCHLPDQTLLLHRCPVLRVPDGGNLAVHCFQFRFRGLNRPLPGRTCGRSKQAAHKAHPRETGLVKAR